MKKQLTVLIIALPILIASVLAQASEPNPIKSLVVITDNHHPLQNKQAAGLVLSHSNALIIYNLDDVKALEKHLSQGLPANEKDAKQVLLQRISSMEQDRFNSKLAEAYGGVFYALKNRINRYPAIIVNDSTAIFGITDLKKALQLYQQWIKNPKVNHHD